MRSSKSRSRSKSNRQRSLGNIINRVFDSSGPEGKVRGTPQQIIDKYLGLARDAQLSNDRVAEQAFLQHAEHYTRLLGEAMREMAREQEARQGQPGNGNGNGGNGQHHDRGDGGGRERYDNRPVREQDDEQPDFAPLAHMVSDEEGPGLVETPEMYAAPQPVSYGGDMDAPRQDAPRQPRGDRGDRGGDRGGNRRNDRGPRPERAAQAEPAAAEPAPRDEPAEASAPRNDRGPRGPRGPRKPKPAVQEGAAGSAPETGGSDGE